MRGFLFTSLKAVTILKFIKRIIGRRTPNLKDPRKTRDRDRMNSSLRDCNLLC